MANAYITWGEKPEGRMACDIPDGTIKLTCGGYWSQIDGGAEAGTGWVWLCVEPDCNNTPRPQVKP